MFLLLKLSVLDMYFFFFPPELSRLDHLRWSRFIQTVNTANTEIEIRGGICELQTYVNCSFSNSAVPINATQPRSKAAQGNGPDITSAQIWGEKNQKTTDVFPCPEN